MKCIVAYDDMKALLQMEYSKGRYDTITKAVEWLDEHLIEYWGQQNSDPSEFLVKFKKSNGVMTKAELNAHWALPDETLGDMADSICWTPDEPIK